MVPIILWHLLVLSVMAFKGFKWVTFEHVRNQRGHAFGQSRKNFKMTERLREGGDDFRN